MYQEFGWSQNDIQRIQFYVSEDIILYRKLRNEDSRITKGKIRVIDGSEVEEFIIEKGTPGVVIGTPDKDKFAVSFESGVDSKYLVFGPGKKTNGRFVLLAKDWDKNYGKISYGSQVYETTSASAYAALMVDIKKAKDVNYKTRKADGNRVRG
jgi:hypothetical protein